MRRSVRGKNTTAKDAEEKEAAPVEPPTSLEKADSMLLSSAELQSGNETPEGCLDEEMSRMDMKGKEEDKPQMLSQPH